MKRKDLIKHLIGNGCVFVREVAKHSVFLNPLTKMISTIPRHTEIHKFLGDKICKDLNIKKPKEF